MKPRNRAAFTLIELLTVMAIIGLLIAMLTPPLSRAREMARRNLCLANLRGIGQGCIAYALSSMNSFPYAGQTRPGFNAIGDAWDYDGVSAATFSGAAPTVVSPVSNTRHLWKLVTMQIADPKSFVCPSDGMAGEPFTPGALKPATQGWSSISDVQNRAQFSYAFQYQGPAIGQQNSTRQGWTTNMKDDPRLVILADGSPAFRAVNPEAVIPADDHTFEFATLNSDYPELVNYARIMGFVATSGNINWDPVTGKATYTLPNPDDVQSLNSQNHRGDGHNIIRLDGSGDFATNPWAGVQMDNIWTVQGNPAGGASEYAKPPSTRDATAMLKERMLGLYDGATFPEVPLLTNWVLYKESKTTYPDSFLVP